MTNMPVVEKLLSLDNDVGQIFRSLKHSSSRAIGEYRLLFFFYYGKIYRI